MRYSFCVLYQVAHLIGKSVPLSNRRDSMNAAPNYGLIGLVSVTMIVIAAAVLTYAA